MNDMTTEDNLRPTPTATALAVQGALEYMAVAAGVDAEEAGTTAITRIKNLFKLKDWDADDNELADNSNIFYELALPEGSGEEAWMYNIMQRTIGINAFMRHCTSYLGSYVENVTDENFDTDAEAARDSLDQLNDYAYYKRKVEKEKDVIESNGISRVFSTENFLLHKTDNGFEIDFTSGPLYPNKLESVFTEFSMQHTDSARIAAEMDEQQAKGRDLDMFQTAAYDNLIKMAQVNLAAIENFFGVTLRKRSDLTKTYVKRVAPKDLDATKIFPGIKIKEDPIVAAKFTRPQVIRMGKYVEFKVTLHPNDAYLRANFEEKGEGGKKQFIDREIDAVMALLGCQVSVMPVLKMSTKLAEYVAQSTPVNTATLWMWVRQWINGWFVNQNWKISDVVVPLSKSAQITARKADLGVYVQPTRSNEDDFNVDTDGVFQYTPPTQTDSTLATRYEEMVERMVTIASEIGEPISPTRVTLDSMKVNATPERKALFDAAMKVSRDLKSLERLPLVVSWDLNLSMCLNDFGVQEIPLEGACKPRDNSVGSVLTRTAQETMLRFVKGSYSTRGQPISKAQDLIAPNDLMDLPVTEYAARIASYLSLNSGLKSPSEYLKAAATELNRKPLTKLDPEWHMLHNLNPMSTAHMAYESAAVFVEPTGTTFGPDALDASGLDVSDEYRDSYKRRIVKLSREAQFPHPLNNLSYDIHSGEVRDKLDDTGKKWLAMIGTHNLYRSFFRAFFGILDQLNSGDWEYNWRRALKEADSKLSFDEQTDIIDSFRVHLLDDTGYFGSDEIASTGEHMGQVIGRTIYGVAFSKMCGDILDLFRKSDIMSVTGDASFYVHQSMSFLPNYKQLSMGTLPWLYFWGKVLPRSDVYVAAHKVALAKNQGQADLPEYATGQDFKLFPHQATILKINAVAPDVQVGDTAPGGGKTTMNILSAINFITNHDVSRVFVLAPNNLLVNYANDLQMLSGHNWNYIPLVTDTFNRWGEEALAKLIMNAPRNTIIGIGMDWLSKANRTTVQIGTVQRDIYQPVEFLRQLMTDNCAILIDEAHKLRKYSQRNKCVTTIMHDPRVKFKIQVTGTIVVDDLTDVIPQARLYDPMIYGSVDEFRDRYFNGSGVWTQESIRAMRKKLSEETAFSRFTKKDWAFCLPSPIETFKIVKLPKEMQAVYDAILKETLAKIEEDAKSNPALRKLLDSLAEGTDNDDDEKDVAGMLSPYMARLERFLMDPEGDLLGAKLKGVRSPKIDHAITLLQNHFNGYTDANQKVHKADPNKVIITTRYKRSAAAMYRNLPPELKKMAVYYDAGHIQNKQRFDTDPKCRIICAVEHSIIEGFNMQNSSRIIRMESLWSPGELDQMTSRIFRPDVDNRFGREHVFLDWIITDNTMETAKIARLISKMMAKAAFDEYGNHAYDELPQLPKIRMTLDTFRRSPSFSDYAPYMAGYTILNKIRANEFNAARTETKKKYGDKPFTEIKGGAIPDDFRVIRTPIFPGARMPDPLEHGYKLINTYFLEDENEAVRETPQMLVGKPVRTDTGYGVITKVTTGVVTADTESDAEDDEATDDQEAVKLKTVTIEYADYFNEDGTRYVEKMSGSRLNMVFLAETVPAADLPLYTEEHHWDAINPTAMRQWADTQLTTIADAKKAGKKKTPAKNQQSGQEDTPAAFQQGNTEEDWSVTMHIATINGVPAVYVDPTDPDVSVIDWVENMSTVGTYVYSHAKNLADFDATMEWLTKNYTMAKANIDYLNQFRDLFKAGRTKRFDHSLLGNVGDIRSFHQATHRKKPAGQLSVYPMVEDGLFYFVIDKGSNASAPQLLNKVPKGASTSAKFAEAGPFQMFLLNPTQKKKAIVDFIKSVLAQEFTIANDADLREQFANLDW